VRSTTDAFHRPRKERLAQGPSSGDGYYLDSHQLDVVVDDLLVHLLADERCDRQWLRFLLDDLPTGPVERAAALDARLQHARWPRYRAGWRRYLEAAHPTKHATVVVDNDDIEAPQIVRWA
jgi:hypothetical protein